MTRSHPTSHPAASGGRHRAALCALLGLWAAHASATTPATPTDPALPEAPWGWQAPNPWREATGATGRPASDVVLQRGQQAYQAHCAQCHGQHAVEPTAEAPDLRRLDSFCRRLKDAALSARCRRDVDSYFAQSVREGKVRAGVVHMPAREGQLSPSTAWAIQQFIEAQPRPQPRLTTRVDAERAAGR